MRADSVKTISLEQKRLEIDSIIQRHSFNDLKHTSSFFLVIGGDTRGNLLWFGCWIPMDLLETTAVILHNYVEQQK